MSFILFALALTVLVSAGLWLAWRAIGGQPGRHAGHETFDWKEDRPHFSRGRPDRLDRLMSQYTVPAPLLEELLRIDRLVADVDAFLRPV